jgi:hypothetical protein
MAKRIGKYKVSKKESALSLADGGSISGEITSNAAARFKVAPAWITNGDADLTVTEALHAGKVIYQTDVSADKDYNIATPSAAGVTYRFIGVGTGAAADGHDIILDFSDDACYFKGAITFLDTDNEVSAIWGNGTSHDRLQINVPASYDLTLVALSTSVMYITGTVVGATAPGFAAQD